MATSLVLASASPRRRDLLSAQGLAFEIHPADVPEVPREGETPVDFTCRVAADKAAAVARRRPDALVLAADTSVVFGGRALGKPADEDEACATLRSLSGETHEVITAVCLLGPAVDERFAIRTAVRFRQLADGEIRRYVATGEPMDKAGAYAIQGRGGAFVEAIFGSFTNVVGLPLAETLAVLKKVGITPGGEEA